MTRPPIVRITAAIVAIGLVAIAVFAAFYIIGALAAVAVCAALGIGLMEWRVVCNLGAEPGRSAARIAEISGVDKSVVSRAVTELERQGLITTASGPPGRQTALRLTPRGQSLHDRGVSRADERELLLLEGFDAGEQDQLVDFLKRLTANLERLEDGSRDR